MYLYHGSNQIVQNPIIIAPNRGIDFGTGFYTTANHNQASEYAKKIIKKRNGESIVNVFEINEIILNNYKVQRFSYPDENWLKFVVANRQNINQNSEYDLIIGPVANDDVFKTIQLYESGVLNIQQTLDVLKIKTLFNQYVFKNDIILQELKFINYEKIQEENYDDEYRI